EMLHLFLRRISAVIRPFPDPKRPGWRPARLRAALCPAPGMLPCVPAASSLRAAGLQPGGAGDATGRKVRARGATRGRIFLDILEPGLMIGLCQLASRPSTRSHPRSIPGCRSLGAADLSCLRGSNYCTHFPPKEVQDFV